ncbi:ABC transporter permease [soil metagenome]
MERLFQDLRFGARLLWKDRGFTVTALLTLAVCIAANGAIFAVVNSILLRPLPGPDSEQLVYIYNSYPGAGIHRASTGVPDYYDRLEQTDAFEELALYQTRGLTMGGDGADPQRISGMAVRPSLFRMLRAQPARGRLFDEEEAEPGEDRKVVLSHGLWQETFGGRDDALGGTLRLNGELYTVVGVLPPQFHFMDPDIRLWVPLSFSAQQRSDDARHSNSWTMVGRLKPGATVTQAQQQIDAVNARNLERFAELRQVLINAGFHTVVTSLQDDMVRDVKATLYLLWGGVLFVLLIGAVNLTNLVLVRSSARMKELATRHALGAALPRLTRQLLTETVLLTVAGGLAGALLAYWGLGFVTTLGLDHLPRGSEIRMDAGALAFTLGLAVALGLAVGSAPILNMRQMNLSQAFREEGRSGTTGRGARTVRRVLVASQVAFAFMLLIGAGLLLASFERVLAVDPGFQPSGLMTARVAPPVARYAGPPELRTFANRLLERVRALPGIEHAGLSSSIPFGGDFSDSVILAEGYQMAPGESIVSPYRVVVSPGYLESLGVPLVAGRTFHDSDVDGAPNAIIVDERLARRFWPDGDAVGRRMFSPDNPSDLTKPGPNARWYTVVGVVGTTKMAGLVTEEDRAGTYYFPLNQSPMRSMTLVVRAAGDPLAMAPAVRGILRELDPELPLYSVRTMEERMHETVTDRRTPMVLALGFAGVALFLAAVGIYGVLAFQVSQRTRELGIRMALGSDAVGIFALILKEGVALLAAGLVVGLAGALALRRALEAQLYEVSGMDPVVLASVSGVLAGVALIACTIPARRASRTDPMLALSEQANR